MVIILLHLTWRTFYTFWNLLMLLVRCPKHRLHFQKEWKLGSEPHYIANVFFPPYFPSFLSCLSLCECVCVDIEAISTNLWVKVSHGRMFRGKSNVMNTFFFLFPPNIPGGVVTLYSGSNLELREKRAFAVYPYYKQRRLRIPTDIYIPSKKIVIILNKTGSKIKIGFCRSVFIIVFSMLTGHWLKI